MSNNSDKPGLCVSIIITVVSGKESVRRCLEALLPQLGSHEAEIIVPYDEWSADVGDLADHFPGVCFQFFEAPRAQLSDRPARHHHRLYERRRAAGLALSRGRIIAMTEDHVIPAADWYSQIILTHEQPYAVIGGLIDNQVDRPMNWALYYCDFGRYGSPLSSGQSAYVSDVNVTYKRGTIESIRDIWHDGYQETTVHWALQSRGEELFLDSRLVVYQHRPTISFRQAYRERIEWGRIFAETRIADCNVWYRMFYAAGTLALPGILVLRILRHMSRQRRSIAQIAKTIPLAICLLTGWALGELAGYLMRKPREVFALAATEPSTQ